MASQASGSLHFIAETGDLHLEDAPSKAVSDGYEKLARLMSLSPGTAIFRRFQALNTTNLLRLQAELQDMEHELAEIRSDDSHSKDTIRSSYYNLLIDIGKKLQEYNAALAQAHELGKTAKPNPREVGFLRDWLVRPTMGAMTF
ncbi:MAG: hypothetical protein Q9176_004054 [Flavoplaca citrina]